jgi:hypothetical protein
MESRSAQPNHSYQNERDTEPQYPRHRPPSAIGHWTRTLGALVPLVIGELVEDPKKKWRFIRVASVALAVINEASYAYAVQQDRRDREARRERR